MITLLLCAEWKHAVVIAIHKSGPKTDSANFRPISVLPVFSKILERAIHRMVYVYLQDKKLLSIPVWLSPASLYPHMPYPCNKQLATEH